MFRVDAPFSHCSASTRRGLANMNMSAPHIQKVLGCVKRLKLKHDAPTALEDCLAHIGLPDYKVALYIRHEIKSLSSLRARWATHGWKLIHVTVASVENATDEQLDTQLREALKTLGKSK